MKNRRLSLLPLCLALFLGSCAASKQQKEQIRALTAERDALRAALEAARSAVSGAPQEDCSKLRMEHQELKGRVEIIVGEAARQVEIANRKIEQLEGELKKLRGN